MKNPSTKLRMMNSLKTQKQVNIGLWALFFYAKEKQTCQEEESDKNGAISSSRISERWFDGSETAKEENPFLCCVINASGKL